MRLTALLRRAIYGERGLPDRGRFLASLQPAKTSSDAMRCSACRCDYNGSAFLTVLIRFQIKLSWLIVAEGLIGWGAGHRSRGLMRLRA